jgi:mono/diheme cytochrome c family protein
MYPPPPVTRTRIVPPPHPFRRQQYEARQVAAIALVVAITAVAVAAFPANADGRRPDLRIVTGGRLYDNWIEQLLATPPEARHPKYPADGPASAADSWRCVTCHGWDYRGGYGSPGPARPGPRRFPGIAASAGRDEAEIRRILVDPVHRYDLASLSPRAIAALALFVNVGQLDVDAVIDRESGRGRGDPARGRWAYTSVCLLCHGAEGDSIVLTSGGVHKSIGTLARYDPWLLLHKIRFGHPGAFMAGFANYATDELANILAYAQTVGIRRDQPLFDKTDIPPDRFPLPLKRPD